MSKKNLEIKKYKELDVYFKKIDHVDIKTIEGDASLRSFISGMLSYYPWWILVLYRIREIVVHLLGLVKHEKPNILPSILPEDLSFEPGKNASFFIVQNAKENIYWVAGTPPNKHLKAYFGVVAEKLSSELTKFHVFTTVKYIHWTGPVYFNLIRPFPHLVVSTMMKAGINQTRNKNRKQFMKTIGLLGGMSWESTASYYREINEGIKEKLGGLHSAKLLLYSVDFDEIEKLQHLGKWSETAELLGSAAKRLETAGADFILICTNTMHKVAPEIEAVLEIPLLHIADATADEIKKNGIFTVGLLGTCFTMEQDFYKGRLEDAHGIKVVVPDSADREIVHQVIYDELCQGEISADSRNEFVRIIKMLYSQGAEAVILGCTEIALLVQQEHTTVPLFDTTKIHAKKAVEAAILD